MCILIPWLIINFYLVILFQNDFQKKNSKPIDSGTFPFSRTKNKIKTTSGNNIFQFKAPYAYAFNLLSPNLNIAKRKKLLFLARF